MTTYTATKSVGGIIADGAHVPADPANRDWQAKLIAESGGPISIDPEIVLGLSEAKAAAKLVVDRMADAERAKHMPAGLTAQSLLLLRLGEAERCDVDGTPTAGEYPLLQAEVGTTGVDLAAVADAVLAEVAALKTDLAAIEAVRVSAREDIDGTTMQSQIDAILAAIVWPV